jgi:hypothetical protein
MAVLTSKGGLQSAVESSRNGEWVPSHELRTFSVGPLITSAQVPAFPHSESDVIHLLEYQCLLSRTVNNAVQAMTKL